MMILIFAILSFLNIHCGAPKVDNKSKGQEKKIILDSIENEKESYTNNEIDTSNKPDHVRIPEVVEVAAPAVVQEVDEDEWEETIIEVEEEEEPEVTTEEESTEEEAEVIVPEPEVPTQPIKTEPQDQITEEDIQAELNTIEENTEEEIIDDGKPDHSVFNALLNKYVSKAGNVDYAGLKSEVSKLDLYLADLSNNTIADNWSRNEKLAYWINAYNAFTIKLILNNYPLSSIMNLDGGKPWDVKWIQLGSSTYSLNQIENEIIRPQFQEPRIHFAVNCAAKSCPPMANKAFTADNLNALLESRTKAFINNTKYNSISATAPSVSKIFEWYAGDFGNLIDYLNKYTDVKIKSSANVTYKEYDWALNK